MPPQFGVEAGDPEPEDERDAGDRHPPGRRHHRPQHRRQRAQEDERRAPDRGEHDQPGDVLAAHRLRPPAGPSQGRPMPPWAEANGVSFGGSSSRLRPKCALRLQGQQRPLALEPARVAGQRAVRADDPMAGHDDGPRIAPGRGAGRAHAAAAGPPAPPARGRRSSRRRERRRSPPTPRAGTACRGARAAGRSACARPRSTRRAAPAPPAAAGDPACAASRRRWRGCQRSPSKWMPASPSPRATSSIVPSGPGTTS